MEHSTKIWIVAIVGAIIIDTWISPLAAETTATFSGDIGRSGSVSPQISNGIYIIKFDYDFIKT